MDKATCYRCGKDPYDFPPHLAVRVKRPICEDCIYELVALALEDEQSAEGFWRKTEEALKDIERRRLSPTGL